MDRTEALRRLWALEGQDLRILADKYNVPIWYKNGIKNDRWVRNVVERHLSLPRDCLRFTISSYWEFQMISLRYLENGELAVKDALHIGMIDSKYVMAKEFYNSFLRRKLRRLILGVRIYEGKNERHSLFYKLIQFDLYNRQIYYRVKADYELIQMTIINDGLDGLTHQMGNIIYPRQYGTKKVCLEKIPELFMFEKI